MRIKSILLSCILSVLYLTAFSQGNNSNAIFSGTEHYQSAFFNPFFYDDFSYRFLSTSNCIENSFGKSIALPNASFLTLEDSINLDSSKALSNIYLVLGTQKNQALQLENLQKIGKSTFLYLNYNSVASLGFIKNSASKNRSFALNLAHNSKYYNLNADFLILTNYDASSGGITDSLISSKYSKRDLQQLNVNLPNDYLKKKYYNINLKHQFNIFSSSSGEKKVSMILRNDYAKFGYLYSGDGFNSFYKNVFVDSSITNDTCGHSWFKNEVGITSNIKSLEISINVIKDDFNVQMSDSVYFFNDWSYDLRFSINPKDFNISGSYSKNLGNNFRSNNEVAKVSVLYQLRNSWISSVELSSSFSKLNVPFVYQKQFSNHFYWNDLKSLPMEMMNTMANFKVKNNFVFSASAFNYKNRVYLNENIAPIESTSQENIIKLNAIYNDTIRNLHFIENLIYANSNSVQFPVVPIQSFTRVGYMFSMFKNNLKVEAGISGIYNDKWYATSYSPALDDFYLQTDRKFGDLLVLNLFADFKIKSATLFLKLEHVNNGWFNENSFIRDGYIAPPRTLRFGFNWPLVN